MTVAHQASLSMEFSRQDYWSALPCPPLGDLPDPEIEHTSLTSPALAGGFFTTGATWETLYKIRGDMVIVGLPRWHIQKQRHYFANNGSSSQGYGFSCGHVWM